MRNAAKNKIFSGRVILPISYASNTTTPITAALSIEGDAPVMNTNMVRPAIIPKNITFLGIPTPLPNSSSAETIIEILKPERASMCVIPTFLNFSSKSLDIPRLSPSNTPTAREACGSGSTALIF